MARGSSSSWRQYGPAFFVFLLVCLALAQRFGRQSSAARRGSHRHHGTRARGDDDADPGASRPRQPPAANGDDDNLLLGNPSAATTAADNYLLRRSEYALSYNAGLGEPNWVSWHLQSSDLGEVGRGNFAPDPVLPPAWQIRPTDYRGSGFDRGHLCPSGDRTATDDENDATFFMSNMVPQSTALNRHAWEQFEEFCRDLATQGDELYIVAGGIGSQGRIGPGKVNIPAACWKIALVLPEGNNDLARINRGTRVIAIDMPNEETTQLEDAPWQNYITSVASLETKLPLRFFTSLPAATRASLERKVDAGN